MKSIKVTKEVAKLLFNAACIAAQAGAASLSGRETVKRLLKVAGFEKAKVSHNDQKQLRETIVTATLEAAPQVLKEAEAKAIKSKVGAWISRAHADLANTVLNAKGEANKRTNTKPKAVKLPKPIAGDVQQAIHLIMQKGKTYLTVTKEKALGALLAEVLEGEKRITVAASK